ncbi:outer membrane protein transport protein [Aureitalea sp. L0-47]|uniref:OmpP1/FadL family transporter n=1 Tax=Aureitalea sp. L0-47 TaxID=2816962 RepID=UPI0022378920|nr:outer membrane protein transport protein [Aureitalea sp. L0-47]MCW5521163.1 outer membrane protein transport protein [Aureitalea sp. L0-47]
MKRIYFLLIAGFVMTCSTAQNITDGLRYGVDRTTGTARYTAMSGAFGALGGDLSAIGINPASSAIFLANDVSVTLGVLDRENNSVYFGTEARGIDTDVDINQAGAVFVFLNPNEGSDWKKFTIGLNYNNTNNLDDDTFIRGNGNTSIGQYFLTLAQGVPLELLELQGGESISDLYSFLGETEGVAAQNAFLGYQGFIFDPVDPMNPGNTQYTSNIAPGRFSQEFYDASEGWVGKYTINFGAQYTEDLYFGINLNFHSIDYFNSNYLFESNSNQGSLVNQVEFENNLSALGNGFSAQIGGIYKISNEFRLGFTYDTPTWYEISEETTQYLRTVRTEDGQPITTVVNPNVLNVFADYELRTPGRIAASAAYVFGQQGLISVDYSYKDYSQTEFSSDFGSGDFTPLNTAIDNVLKGASSIKVGGEYRIDELSLRAGMQYEESPYENEITVGDLTGFSLGLGYDFGDYNFDLAYSRLQQDRNQQLFDVGLTSTSMVETTFNNIIFTLGVNL